MDSLDLRNMFIMAPVKLGYSNGKGQVTDKHLQFYDARSKHIGGVTLEPLYIDSGLRELPTQLGIDSDDKIKELKKITSLIHENGAKAIAHLNHPGRMANPKIPGNYWWSSTDKPCPNNGAIPIAMDREKMDKVKELLVNAAIRAEKAGFDIIELQYGHGYLMAQFLSEEVNDRTDEYGGSFENRIKYPVEVFDAVKTAVSIPVIIRLSATEFSEKGIKMEESIKLAHILEKHGAAAFQIIAGSACSTPPWFFQHMFVPKGKTWEFAGRIKKEISSPIIFVGQVNSIEDINYIKEHYNAEYISMGRAMVADPDFVGKYLGIIKDNIRPCLACSEGCLGGVKSGKGLGCVVNPQLNTGLVSPQPATKQKHIAVVGGGLAGMEAAVTLAQRGHKVDLYEKDQLGGQFNLAYLPPHKQSLKKLVDYYIDELKAKQVNVIHKEAQTNDLINYDDVIIATGSVPAIPPIEGLSKYQWAEILFEDKTPTDTNCLIIGGGLIGLEIASKLVENNNKVIIVEMLEEVARGMEMIEKALTLKYLKENDVEIITSAKVEAVKNNKVIISYNGTKKEITGIEHIILATGMKPYLPFDIKNAHIIGDAKNVGKAQTAIRDGYEIGISL